MKETTMVRKPALKGTVGALAITVATAGLIAPTHATAPIGTPQAGTLYGWGAESSAAAQTLPENLQDTAFIDVESGSSVTLALTAAGKIVSLGASPAGNGIHEIPTSLDTATVTDLVMAP